MRSVFWLLITHLSLASRISIPVTRIETKVQPLEPFEQSEATGLEFAKSIPIDLTNYQNFQYYATLSIGSSKFTMDFVFDTGSNELWFPTTTCDTCEAGTKRYATSSSSYYKRTSSQLRSITYGRGYVEGYPSEEQVWFTQSDKIDKMPCLAVEKQRDLNGIKAEGILGLAPLERSGQPPFLLDLMVQNGLIDSRKLSFAYHRTNRQSTIVFGEPDLSMIQSTSRNASLPIIAKGILYFVDLSESKIGEITLSSANNYALIDTGTSLIAIPKSPYYTLLQFYNDNGGRIQYCGSQICAYCRNLNRSPLVLTLGSSTFQVPFSELWITSGNVCYLAAYLTSSSQWILGDAFIRNYYFIIDYDQGRIHIYGNNIKKASSRLSPWIVALIVVACLLVIVVCTYFLCCRGKKVKKHRHGPYYSSGRERLLNRDL